MQQDRNMFNFQSQDQCHKRTQQNKICEYWKHVQFSNYIAKVQ